MNGDEPPVKKQSFADKDLDYTKEFWTVGNVIAGFSVVQALWFFTTIGPEEGILAIAVRGYPGTTGLATIAVTACYLVGTAYCHSAQFKILDRYDLPNNFKRQLSRFWCFRCIVVFLAGASVSAFAFSLFL